MSTTMHEAVEKALQIEWPVFVQRHPHLATVVDRAALVQQVVQRLAADPAYQSALDRSAVVATALSDLTAAAQRVLRAIFDAVS